MSYAIGALVRCVMVDVDIRSHAVCRDVLCIVRAVYDEDWGTLGILRSYEVRAVGHHWPDARVWPSSLDFRALETEGTNPMTLPLDIVAFLCDSLDCGCDQCAGTKRWMRGPETPLVAQQLAFLARFGPAHALARFLPPVLMAEAVALTWAFLAETGAQRLKEHDDSSA